MISGQRAIGIRSRSMVAVQAGGQIPLMVPQSEYGSPGAAGRSKVVLSAGAGERGAETLIHTGRLGHRLSPDFVRCRFEYETTGAGEGGVSGGP